MPGHSALFQPSTSPETSKNTAADFIPIRKALEDYPEVSREISESGYGLLLSFLKVAIQPESQQVTDQVTDEVLRLVSVIQGKCRDPKSKYCWESGICRTYGTPT